MLLNSLLLAADGTTTEGSNSGWIMYVVIGVVLVLMIVLTIIPQKKRQKEQQTMMNSLVVGTKLMTVGGLVGKITQINADNTLIINVGTESNPTLIVIDKKAVGYVLENVAKPAEPVAEDTVDETPANDNAEDATADDAVISDDAFAPANENDAVETVENTEENA